MGDRARVVAVALVMVTAVALSACGSGTSAQQSGTDDQRNAMPFAKDVTLCVTGRTGSPMKVYLSPFTPSGLYPLTIETESDPKQTGPFPLIENSCFTNNPVLASVYNADGTNALSIVTENPAIGEPYAVVVCRAGDRATETKYSLSEGLRRTYDCGQLQINVERMTDSETEKHFQANVGLR